MNYLLHLLQLSALIPYRAISVTSQFPISSASLENLYMCVKLKESACDKQFIRSGEYVSWTLTSCELQPYSSNIGTVIGRRSFRKFYTVNSSKRKCWGHIYVIFNDKMFKYTARKKRGVLWIPGRYEVPFTILFCVCMR